MHLALLLHGPYEPSFPIDSLPELPAQPKTDDPLKCIVLADHTPTQRKKKSYLYPKRKNIKRHFPTSYLGPCANDPVEPTLCFPGSHTKCGYG